MTDCQHLSGAMGKGDVRHDPPYLDRRGNALTSLGKPEQKLPRGNHVGSGSQGTNGGREKGSREEGGEGRGRGRTRAEHGLGQLGEWEEFPRQS